MALFPSQSLKPVTQRLEHMLDEHRATELGLIGQTVPHAPQFIALDRVSISQPFVASPSQSKKPVEHTARHIPMVHTGVVPGRAEVQTAPHVPQCASVVRVSTSHPLRSFPSQSAKPGEHCDEHTPIRHEATELIPALQRLPHAPQ